MDLVKALDVSVEFPTLRTLRRPGKSETDLLITLSLGAQWQRHFFRVTPLPPKAVLLWSEDVGVILDLGRGQFHTVCRHLARKRVIYVYPAGSSPASLQVLDIATLTSLARASRCLDIDKARGLARNHS